MQENESNIGKEISFNTWCVLNNVDPAVASAIMKIRVFNEHFLEGDLERTRNEAPISATILENMKFGPALNPNEKRLLSRIARGLKRAEKRLNEDAITPARFLELYVLKEDELRRQLYGVSNHTSSAAKALAADQNVMRSFANSEGFDFDGLVRKLEPEELSQKALSLALTLRRDNLVSALEVATGEEQEYILPDETRLANLNKLLYQAAINSSPNPKSPKKAVTQVFGSIGKAEQRPETLGDLRRLIKLGVIRNIGDYSFAFLYSLTISRQELEKLINISR